MPKLNLYWFTPSVKWTAASRNFCTGCSVERRRFNQLDGTAKGGVALAVVADGFAYPLFVLGKELKTSALFPATNSSKLCYSYSKF